jgi:hypothetical protein
MEYVLSLRLKYLIHLLILVQSYATLVHNSRSSRPEVIVSVNYALRYTIEIIRINSEKFLLVISKQNIYNYPLINLKNLLRITYVHLKY